MVNPLESSCGSTRVICILIIFVLSAMLPFMLGNFHKVRLGSFTVVVFLALAGLARVADFVGVFTNALIWPLHWPSRPFLLRWPPRPLHWPPRMFHRPQTSPQPSRFHGSPRPKGGYLPWCLDDSLVRLRSWIIKNLTWRGLFWVWSSLDQISMGYPLGPALDNIFIGFHKKGLLSSPNKLEGYIRYVDDTFFSFIARLRRTYFFTSFSNIHSTLRFTFDRETNFRLPFQDVLVGRTLCLFDIS